MGKVKPIKNLTSTSELENFIKENELSAVAVSTDSCAPCRVLQTYLETSPDAIRKRKDIAVAKINIDLVPDLKNAYRIESVPVLMTFHKGQLIQRPIAGTEVIAKAALDDLLTMA